MNIHIGIGGRGPPLGDEAPCIGPLLGLGRRDKELEGGFSGFEDGVEGRFGTGGLGGRSVGGAYERDKKNLNAKQKKAKFYPPAHLSQHRSS